MVWFGVRRLYKSVDFNGALKRCNDTDASLGGAIRCETAFLQGAYLAWSL